MATSSSSKSPNRTNTPLAVQQGLVVVKVHATNASDKEKIRLLLERLGERTLVSELEKGGTKRGK